MKRIYSVLDVKAEAYGPLFAVPHDAVAIREFGAAISQNGSVLKAYPDDFVLMCVGAFYDVDEVERPKTPVEGFVPSLVISARQWIDSQPKESE